MKKSFEKEKRLGLILIIVGVLIVLFSSTIKIIFFSRSSLFSSMVIWFVAGILVATGFMLRRSDEAQKMVEESQLKINEEFKNAKKRERQKDEFIEFLSQFSKEEVEVIEYVHTYEGIMQSKLEKNVSMNKKEFGTIIRKLEKKDIIALMPSGSTNKIFLKKISRSSSQPV